MCVGFGFGFGFGFIVIFRERLAKRFYDFASELRARVGVKARVRTRVLG